MDSLQIRNFFYENLDANKFALTHTGTGIKIDPGSNNKQLTEELHKPIMRKFLKNPFLFKFFKFIF